jgi:DNA-binding transcriptional ArsR family regulator
MPAPQKNVAAWLATYVNGEDGTNAHPGTEALIKATGLSRSSVLRSLSALEEAGFIRVLSQGGGKGSAKGRATVWELAVPVDNLGHLVSHRHLTAVS